MVKHKSVTKAHSSPEMNFSVQYGYIYMSINFYAIQFPSPILHMTWRILHKLLPFGPFDCLISL
jgi:hypothetical protein